ncbi:DUF5693 family protein [Oceanobacillus sojae]|uniref:DUF5693 family protein n=1 Tax=Oceanobacillus sojae TaxID=582851 RepID=UPI0021A4E0BD|nr:DUF5693 family protein [Oceanobacillus sojae]MCT1905339.1 DUF5693 family protein [Oceanobacillus sojae]
MKKPFYIFSLVVLLLIISLPGIFNRAEVESANRIYEIMMPLEDLRAIAEAENRSDYEVLEAFKAAGLEKVQLDYLTLARMEENQQLSIYSDAELTEALRFSPEYKDSYVEKGIYVTIPRQSSYENLLTQHFYLDYRIIGGERFYYFTDPGVLEENIGYDAYYIQMLHKADMDYVFSLPNQNSHESSTLLHNYRHPSLQGVLFSSGEVAGYPVEEDMQAARDVLQKNGLSFYQQEFSALAGFPGFAKETNYQFIRMHAITLGEKELEESVQQAVRAIKERNIRSILVTAAPERAADGITFIERLQQQMPAHFIHGDARPFQTIATSNWIQPLLLLAGVLFGYGLLRLLPFKIIRIAMVSLLVLAGAAWLITDYLLLLKLFAWLIAVLTAVCAVLISANSRVGLWKAAEKGAAVWLSFLQALGITVIGILLIIGLLNGNEFISGVELFRGIKLLHIVPPFLVFLVLFGYYLAKQHRHSLLNIFNKEVRVWHVIVCFGLLLIFAYYIIRTGNSNLVSPWEITIRHTLEEILYVRPRTKEFLIGYPAMIIGLYFLPRSPIIGRFLLVIGSIGFLSMINTFTHFHSPLFVSLLRSVYGIGLGVILGYFVLFLIVWGRKYWAK